VAIAGALGSTLDLGGGRPARPGDLITVTVTPFDTTAGGQAASSAGVRVVNGAALRAAYRLLAAGYHDAYAAYLSLGTPAAYAVWVWASWAWSYAQYGYSVDSHFWARASICASLAAHSSRSVFLSSGSHRAHVTYVAESSGWRDARGSVPGS
jgi:hypothetical protein